MTQSKPSAKPDASPRIHVLFVAGFGPIVREPASSRRLYSETLGIGFEEEEDGYLHTQELDGTKNLGLWPLSAAAESCFGRSEWPNDVPAPHAWIEFDVDNVDRASQTLVERGYRLLVRNRKEPWGQTVTRFLSPEGLLVGVTHTPQMRE